MNGAFGHDFFMILPEVELTLFGLAILLLDHLLGVKEKAFNAVVAMFGVGFSGYSLYRLRALGAGCHRQFLRFDHRRSVLSVLQLDFFDRHRAGDFDLGPLLADRG